MSENEEFPAVGNAPEALQSASVDPGVVEETENRPVSRLVFTIAGHGLLLHQETSMEFLEDQTPYHIPNNHPQFRGLINRRGSLVPVYEIRSLLNDDHEEKDSTRLLVLGSGDDAVGIFLDATPYRVSLAVEPDASPPDGLVRVFGDLVEGCYAQNEERFTQVALEDFMHKLVHDRA